MRNQKVVLITYSLIILMTVVGCERQVAPAPPPPSPTVWKSTYLSISLGCPSADYCHYVIEVGPFNDDKQVNVALRAAYGIKFRNDLPPYEGLILSDAGRMATIKDIGLQQNETRIVYIPFSIWSGEELTGEYIVDVALTSVDQSESVINQLQIKAFIQNGSDNSSDRHQLKLVSTQADFDRLYPFVGDEPLAAFIQLDKDNQYPREGNLYVKLVASHSGCQPMITLHGDGVEIEQRSTLIMANTGESRIVEFQFRIVEGEQERDGLHIFSISVEGENHISIHQTLPVAVNIVSEPDTHQQHWLEKTEVNVVSTIGQTAVDHRNTLVTGPNGGEPPSSYSETVTIGNNVAKQSNVPPSTEGIYIDQAGGGIPLEHTYTPTAPPPEPTPTLPPSPLTPPAVVAGGHDGAYAVPTATPTVDDKTAVFDPRCSDWKRTISTTSNLALLDVYHQHVEKTISEMSVNRFVLVFRLCNRISAEVGEVILGAGEMYYLPNSDRP